VPRISNALAIDHDLTPLRPPYRTLYGCGSNRPASFSGNCALTGCVGLDKLHLDYGLDRLTVRTRDFILLLINPAIVF